LASIEELRILGYHGVVQDAAHFSKDPRGLYFEHHKLLYHGVPLPPLTYRGEVQVILGNMYAGKTSALQRRGRRMAIAKKRVLFIKLGEDDRYAADQVVTHDGAAVDAISCTALHETVEAAFRHDVLCIDEGQFFPNLVEYCDLMANVGKVVIVAMLAATFERRPFPSGNPLSVVAIARTVAKLTAVCQRCGFDGAENSSLLRRGDAQRASGDGKLIGGSGTYAATCRQCYFENFLCGEGAQRVWARGDQ